MSVLIVLLGVPPKVSAAEAAIDGKVLNERYKQIVAMPGNERERLERNIAKFTAMNAAEREKYRTLNRQLEENRPLTILLQTYSAWLQTLTPGQRDELRQATDGAQKMALVRKFKEDQQQFQSIDWLTEATSEVGHPGGRGFAAKQISPSELVAVMKLIVAELPADDREKFAKSSRSLQYVDILYRSVQTSSEGARAWPSAGLQEKLLGALQRNDVRNFIKSQQADQRAVLVSMLFNGVNMLALREGTKFPKDAELDKIYGQLPEDEKGRLDQVPPERKRFQLARRFFYERGDNTFQHFDDVRTKLAHLMEQLSLPPLYGRPRGDGRGPGPRGERGGPDDRPHPADRPPPANPPPPGRDGPPPRRPPPQ